MDRDWTHEECDNPECYCHVAEEDRIHKEFYMLMGEVALMRQQLDAMQSRMATFWETTLKDV